ncbi:hypothetical protein D3C78_1979030 [compost metagenome]
MSNGKGLIRHAQIVQRDVVAGHGIGVGGAQLLGGGRGGVYREAVTFCRELQVAISIRT